MIGTLSPGSCARLRGRGVRDCRCFLPDQAGFLECPPEARGLLEPVPVGPPPQLNGHQAAVAIAEAPRPSATLAAVSTAHAGPRHYSGDICHTCGSPNLVRTGTCLTCQDCGDTSGGCS